MIKVFYDETSGAIISQVFYSLDFEDTRVHIDIPEMVNIDRYKVNLTTLELEQLPESEWPVIRRR
jgi:hypothetical protein